MSTNQQDKKEGTAPVAAVNKADNANEDSQQETNNETQDDGFLENLNRKYPLSGGETDEDLDEAI